MYVPLCVVVGRKFRDRVDLERIRQLEQTMQTTLETITRDAGNRRKINAGLRVPNRCPRPAPPIGLPAPKRDTYRDEDEDEDADDGDNKWSYGRYRDLASNPLRILFPRGTSVNKL